MRKKIFLFLILLLTSCTAYVDSRREAGSVASVGQSTDKVLALCYNPLFGNKDEQIRIANEACAPQKAVLKDTKYFNCALFYPNTAFYTCEK